LTPRPFAALWLSAAIAVVSVWVGLTLAYAFPRIPPSFGILSVATACYLLSFLVTTGGRRLVARGGAGGRGPGNHRNLVISHGEAS
jgi:zinc/manganese transport system permease protein